MSDKELIERLRWRRDSLDAKAAERIEVLTGKLAKAVEFTEGVIRHAGNSGDDYLAEQARATLAEIKGESHE